MRTRRRPNSVEHYNVFGSGTVRINFTSVAGEQYRVEYKNVLNAGSWTTLPGAETVFGTGGVMQITDPDPNVRSLPRRFYRVVLL